MIGKHKPKPRDVRRRDAVLALTEDLPGVAITPVGAGHRQFQVGKKTFAYYLYNHHGDGIISICCKSTHARQQELIARDGERYYSPAYLGADGWVGLRIDLPKIDYDEIVDLILAGYRLQAPQKLLVQL